MQVEQRLFSILEASETIEQAGAPFLQTLCETVGWDTGELWLVDVDGKVLTEEVRWSRSQPGVEASRGAPRQLARGEKLAGRAWQEGAPVFSTEPRDQLPAGLAVAALRNLPGYALPISYRQRCLGVLVFRDPLIESPSDDLRQALAAVSQTLGQFLQLKQTEAALGQSESKLRQSQKMDSLGMLTGGIAHDFNNVLTVILSYSEIASDELAPDHLVREMLTEIHNAGRRAASMTRRLLMFTRQHTADLQPLNLNELVADMERMLRRLVGPQISLENSLLPALGMIRADASQVDQLLVNLVVNARDAMPEGGCITISTEHQSFSIADARNHPGIRPGDFVALTVRDTGTGMDEATRARIFEPFFTTKDAGRGTGMGLATVAAIVEQSGGFINVETAPGQGTAMIVYLPRIQQKLATLEVDRRIEPTLGGHETVLIVEDDEDLRKLLRRVIQVRGYSVLEATSAGDAIKVIASSQRPTSLVLMNDGLGGTAYQEACQQLQKSQPRLQIVMISDQSGHGDETAAPAGVHMLSKPFTSQDLARKIRSVLDGAPDTTPALA
ncbi:MAG: ATP-binding protein [Planctomycetaceae bacterium]